jgi:hypothetical protein
MNGMLGKKQSEFQKQRAREANLGNKHGLGAVFTEERREKISAKLKGNQNWKFRKLRECSEETKAKISASRKGILPWNTGLTKEDPRVAKLGEEVSKARKGIPLSESHKANIRKTCQSTKFRKKQSKILQKAIWPPKTVEHMRNVLKSVCTRPNKFETQCLKHLNKLYPGRFSYTGDGTCIINGRSADAMDLKTRTVVLCNGVYWHLKRHDLAVTDKNKRMIERLESEPFLRAGYQVIFLWEDELQQKQGANK